MIRWTGLAIFIVAIALFCSIAHAHVLTFDDVPSGTVLRDSFYMDNYRVGFDPFFQAVDHTASLWGPPRSPSNVLAWISSEFDLSARVLFGYYTTTYADPDDIQSVGAYFSTQAGIRIRMAAYHWSAPDVKVLVTSVVIGGLGESWNNRYVEISSPDGPFNILEFEGVNSPEELLGFCADDMTITPVPEPSSILALLSGLTGIGGILTRRRR